ncbi:hypothetical protein AGOR_G00020400 [Albula goreensis]|uniref:Uncharacterized protein n=1 Tax=Albula goreensis TaxID=1534307 RepID=A0A8T3E7T4_9TELE|nr:hypothetical protein AGOR_G00020400 [Albula goreensis]
MICRKSEGYEERTTRERDEIAAPQKPPTIQCHKQLPHASPPAPLLGERIAHPVWGKIKSPPGETPPPASPSAFGVGGIGPAMCHPLRD